MTRLILDEKSGMIWMHPGHQSKEDQMKILGKALCIGTGKLAQAVGVPDVDIKKCESGNVAAAEHNLKKIGKVLEH